jgi:hypothetical protein
LLKVDHGDDGELAEEERKLISERNRGAAAVRRRKTIKHGLARRAKADRLRLRSLVHAAVQRPVIERTEAYRVHIEWALRQPGLFGAVRPISFGAAANKLNERNIASPTGGRRRGDLLQRMAPRLGIHVATDAPGPVLFKLPFFLSMFA